ncbi:MAG: flavin reductase family protein [Gemmataceae bacterium]|nr:flavin reductase family protein [Gemmataceae bacterium]
MSRASIESVFSLLDREIWLLTAQSGQQRAGLVVTLVSQASIVPDQPRVWVGLSPQHFTTTIVQRSQGFRLHLVDAGQVDLVWKFGTQSGHDVDKFADGQWPESRWGRPQLANPVAWLECAVESHAETGDRVFFLARVLEGAKCTDQPPLTLRGLRRLLSPAQAQQLNANLARDALVDADLMRRWHDAGYLPLAIRPRDAGPTAL